MRFELSIIIHTIETLYL